MFNYLLRKDKLSLLRPISAALLLTIFISRGSEFVVITELLKNPNGASDAIPGDASHEFIEIANFGTDTLSIDSLFLFDGPGGVDSIVPWDPGRHGTLPMHAHCKFSSRACAPGAFAVILDPDYRLAITDNPSSSLPLDTGTTIWTIDDKDIGNSGIGDNDGIVLYKGTKTNIDRTIAFVSDQCPPFSLKDTIRQTGFRPSEGTSLIRENVFFCPPSFSSCPTILSPGHYEKMKNGWITEWKCRISGIDSSVALCSLAVCKAGAYPFADASWSIVRSVSQASSIVKQGVFGAHQQLVRLFAELILDSASYQIAINEKGRISTWNIDLSSLWSPPFAIKINEVFPRAQTDCPEWFELVNISTMPIALRNWHYGNSESSCALTPGETVIAAGGYLVVTKDKKLFSLKYPSISCVCQPDVWLSLDNNKDTLCLWNARTSRCETIAYNAAWFDQWTDQSIERVSWQSDAMAREAWVLASRPSPGQPNGSIVGRGAGKPGLEIGPIRFTPNGDGRDDLLSIQLALPAVFTAIVSIYGFNGKKYIDFPSAPQSRFFWNGTTVAGAKAPVGPFFVVATFKNGSQTEIIRKKGILWR